MSIEKVRDYFKLFNIENRILEMPETTATVELAAKALGCKGQRIAKSLSFKIGDNAIIVVMAGDSKVDNNKYKQEFNCKAKMLTAEEVTTLIGHNVGGVCPFAIQDNVEVYLDQSLKRFKTVFPACGSSNSAIELTIDELVVYSKMKKWVDISKIIVEEI